MFFSIPLLALLQTCLQANPVERPAAKEVSAQILDEIEVVTLIDDSIDDSYR